MMRYVVIGFSFTMRLPSLMLAVGMLYSMIASIPPSGSCQACNPSKACDRPAAKAASVVRRAGTAHPIVVFFFVARSGAVAS
eukprot:2200131-Pleurochrysis_carterae.AAC.1